LRLGRAVLSVVIDLLRLIGVRCTPWDAAAARPRCVIRGYSNLL